MTPPTNKLPDMADLTARLGEAMERADRAAKDARRTAMAETNAINALNAAQDAFDAGVRSCREKPHDRTNWAGRTRVVMMEASDAPSH
ncbi:MAG: hypothetical protein E2598_07635 [Sphingobium sp.]|nr:hypothetical protein [Sphingobium sp.]